VTEPRKPLLRALAGETLERPPFWLMRQAGRYLPEYRALRATAGSFLDLCLNPGFATEVTLQPLRRFGMDAAILFSDILVVPLALGQGLTFAEGEGPRLPPIRDLAGLGTLKETIDLDRLAPVYETVARLAEVIPSGTTLIGFAGAPWTVATYMVEGGSSRGFPETRRWMSSDPAGFGVLIDRLVLATIAHLSAQVDAGAEVVQLFDSWAGALEGDEFDRWAVRPASRIVAALKQRFPGLPVIGFGRGAGDRHLAYAEGTGVDAVSVEQGLPLDWVKNVLQPRTVVQGNLDPAVLVAGGDSLDLEVERLLKTLGPSRFIFNLGHGIVPETPPEHVARLAALIRGDA
jgi:uroporphyrinogen decarboxylase